MSETIAGRLRAVAEKVGQYYDDADNSYECRDALRALASEIEAKAEVLRTWEAAIPHREKWVIGSVPFVADRLAARKEPVETEKETG